MPLIIDSFEFTAVPETKPAAPPPAAPAAPASPNVVQAVDQHLRARALHDCRLRAD